MTETWKPERGKCQRILTLRKSMSIAKPGLVISKNHLGSPREIGRRMGNCVRRWPNLTVSAIVSTQRGEKLGESR